MSICIRQIHNRYSNYSYVTRMPYVIRTLLLIITYILLFIHSRNVTYCNTMLHIKLLLQHFWILNTGLRTSFKLTFSYILIKTFHICFQSFRWFRSHFDTWLKDWNWKFFVWGWRQPKSIIWMGLTFLDLFNQFVKSRHPTEWLK